MVNINEKGYTKVMDLCEQLENQEIDFIKFIDEFEIIAFNNFSGKSIDYFADGWSKGSALRLMKVFLQAYNGDKKAESRLKADLELEEFNLTIKQL